MADLLPQIHTPMSKKYRQKDIEMGNPVGIRPTGLQPPPQTRDYPSQPIFNSIRRSNRKHSSDMGIVLNSILTGLSRNYESEAHSELVNSDSNGFPNRISCGSYNSNRY